MRFQESEIAGVLTFHPTVHSDERGFFSRTWDADVAAAAGLPDFVQDSQSRSQRGVIRALHLRRGSGEAKLVRCAHGRIFDVVVDLRPGSRTFLKWQGFTLDDVDLVSLYIPRGCGHGWQALSEVADVCYRIDSPHDPAQDVTIAFDDPDVGIPWPEPPTIISERDRNGQTLASVLPTLGPQA
jgi:dTDP-4-dehydrorhamnose 3,5-epimerase